MIRLSPFAFSFALAVAVMPSGFSAEPLKALIVDGRNNHDWQTTTDALRAILQSTGRFE
ncbi:MAG: ThuA domain-containing protein, partial [Verrucomicrobiales bacterium]|nr:ThuA domain-containing protein [Verrucomicrobiales bacterium]